MLDSASSVFAIIQFYNQFFMKPFLLLKLSLSLVILLTACSDPNKASEGNLKKGLETYYEQNKAICLRLPESSEFPIKDTTGDIKLDALSDMGLFTKTEGTYTFKTSYFYDGKQEVEVQGYLYSPTKEIEEYLVRREPSDFYSSTYHELCFGKIKDVKVTNFTEPTPAMGALVTKVQYTYTLTDIPHWAYNDLVQYAFSEGAFEDIFCDLTCKLKQNQASTRMMLTTQGWMLVNDPNAWAKKINH